MLDRTEQAILKLRNPLVELFQALHSSNDYNCYAGEMQLEVYFRNEKVGGLNRSNWHFYISKVFVRSHGTPELLGKHGFEWVEHSPRHQYWRLSDVADHQSFRRAIEEMTGVPIQVTKL